MAKQMHWDNPYEYHFDRGLYMHEVSPGLICGTQVRLLHAPAAAVRASAHPWLHRPASHRLVQQARNCRAPQTRACYSPARRLARPAPRPYTAPLRRMRAQPRNPGEVEALSREHGVNMIVNLQQDKDIAYWGIDFGANTAAMERLGLQLVRRPVRWGLRHASGCVVHWVALSLVVAAFCQPRHSPSVRALRVPAACGVHLGSAALVHSAHSLCARARARLPCCCCCLPGNRL